MTNYIRKIAIAALGLMTYGNAAGQISHFDMELTGNKIKDLITQEQYEVTGKFAPENVAGVDGNALRFDGYTSYIDAEINTNALNGQALTVSLWCAAQTYPMVVADIADNQYTYIAGNMDDGARSGFAFVLSSQGNYGFDIYINGWKVECRANDLLPKYEWNHLCAVLNNGQLQLHRNGVVVASTPYNGSISVGNKRFIIGKSFDTPKLDVFTLNTFNGVMDEIKIFPSAVSLAEAGWRENVGEPDLSVPESRFANSLLRPRFHGMPEANWTNEPHGLVYFNGRYHVFFQKNANGPYMSRLHWGHISSENGYKWREEKIAIAPSEWYDIKGCWSGCVYFDSELTGNRPNIFYTAVDNGRATIAQAVPLDDDLINWEKKGIVVDGRPNGLSDDFRDPYVFKSNGNFYMIVGTSKDNIGAVTLHRYNAETQTWSNDGSIFYQGKNANLEGTFWEMPTINQMENGKWMLTATPLGSSRGVEVLYWIGEINEDGTFQPDAAYSTEPKEVELGAFGSDGYGLLSPSISRINGKMMAIGIVPDKLAGSYNYDMGWAHNYSLPREWTLDENNELVQKPSEELIGLRTNVSYSHSGNELNGTVDLTPVRGRAVEVEAEFVVGRATRFGLRFFQSGDNGVEIYYKPSTRKIYADVANVERYVNDGGNRDYSSLLPTTIARGETIKLHVYVDHSILDVFINDKWAFSLRVFPTNANAEGVQAFSEGNEATQVNMLNAWILDPDGNYIPPVTKKPVAFLSDYESLETLQATGDDDEAAAANWLVNTYGGDFLSLSNVNSVDDLDGYEAVWIMIDRVGLLQGSANLPASFLDKVDILKEYSQNAGNIFFSNHATGMTVAMGRTSREPNIFGSGEGGDNADVWGVNPVIGAGDAPVYADHSGHAFFEGVTFDFEKYAWNIIPMVGSGKKEDHNSMWDLNTYGYEVTENTNTVALFEEENDCEVLATWQHVEDYCCAGLVDFHANAHYGRMVAMGIAAYEWNQTQANPYQYNIEQFTKNVLDELVGNVEDAIVTPIVPSAENAIIWTAESGSLRVLNAMDYTSFQIYSIDGSLVGQFLPQELYSGINLNQHGCYIVKAYDEQAAMHVTKILL